MSLVRKVYDFIIHGSGNSSRIYIYNPGWEIISLFFRMAVVGFFMWLYLLTFVIVLYLVAFVVGAIIGYPFNFIFRLVGLGDFTWIIGFFTFPVIIVLTYFAMRYVHKYIKYRFFNDDDE